MNGVPSNAARFQVGSGGQGAGGGGISQNVNTAAGMLTATADIAVSRTQTGTNNAGGLFELLINDVVVDNFDFMSVTGGVDEHASLSGIDTVAAGMQTIAIRMTRPFSNGGTFGTAVFQHVDNVASIFVPEPTTWVLLLIGAMLAPSLDAGQPCHDLRISRQTTHFSE